MPSNDPLYGATWRSGYATVCKTVYTSSILVVASNSTSLTSQHYFIPRGFLRSGPTIAGECGRRRIVFQLRALADRQTRGRR
jgi:hypothetical protein